MEAPKSNYEIRLAHLQALERAGIEGYPAIPFKATINAERLNAPDSGLPDGTFVSIAGRLDTIRRFKQLTFANIQDSTGIAQIAINKDEAPNSDFELMHQNLDTGDFIGVFGHTGKTKVGTPTVWTSHIMMLTKALRETPFKISDPEVAQRQRYLELLTDPAAVARFRTRSGIVQHIRNTFIGIGALEVETPVLDTTYGGASAKPFTTYHEALGEELYLRIAPELYLKRLTSSFQEGVFEFSRNFRNEGMDRTHNPEFTTVELYKPYWDYNDMMDMTEEMVKEMAQKLTGSSTISFQGKEIDLAKKWQRLSIYDGLNQKFGIDPQTASDDEIRRLAQRHLGWKPLTAMPDYEDMLARCKGEIGLGSPRGQVLLELFEAAWEKDLVQPTFVKDYPAETSALTKRHRKNPSLTERFELYIGGLELGNCYTELNDPRDQRERFLSEMAKKAAGDTETMPMDEDFILFQEYGMPQQAGIGLSIDRLTMLLTDTPHIRQAILFPTLKRKQ